MSYRNLLLVFAAAKIGLHLATATEYGYFRDELYYLACSEHLDLGYVDHPSLSILVLRASRTLLGDSLPAIRIVPALAGAVSLVLVGLMTRELGGGRYACALALTAAFVAPAYLSVSQYYSMNALDVMAWAVVAYLFIRMARGEERLWLAVGLALTLGLANKISVLWLGAGLAVGLTATRERRWLLTPGPWLAAGVALMGLAPYLVWQISHGWPTLEFMQVATTEKMREVAPLEFLLGQVEMMHPLTAPLWISGLLFYLAAPGGRRFRLLGFVYLSVFTILVSAGTSRSGYLAPAYTWLLPAGAVVVESWLSSRWARTALVFILILGGAVLAPFTIPLLPVDAYLRYARALGQEPSTEERKELGALSQHYADMHGWEDIVRKIARVWASLPEDERSRVGILAPDYGIAGAIDRFGEDLGLPRASSGHNNYWYWGPTGGNVWIVIGGSEAGLGARFDQVTLALDALDCGYCMPYESQRSVWIARGLKTSLADFWRGVRHFD
ncbi:MAG TPA: glycosyltransferase family 39 protein [Vicinamibacteria bacterium]|nr:glycosyltransferase family 39 protein [Vicinamibacteria bacterium]